MQQTAKQVVIEIRAPTKGTNTQEECKMQTVSMHKTETITNCKKKNAANQARSFWKTDLHAPLPWQTLPPLIPSSARTAKERRRVAPARRGAEQPLAAGCAWAAPRGAPEHGGHFVAPAQT